MSAPASPRSLIVFVHGFGSSRACWTPLLELLRVDERVTARYEFECFEYPTAWFSFNPLRRIPRLRELGRALREFIDSPRFGGRELVLVGHSQGGLVIQSYLAELLEAGQGDRLAAIRQVVLIATPNLGSALLSPLRRLLGAILPNPQERTLRVLDPEIADIRAVITARVVGAQRRSAHAWPVPVTCFYGLQDGVVVEASARGPFRQVVPLEGDHFSILRPQGAEDRRYQEFVEALLEPAPHDAVYLIERFEHHVAVEPLGGEQDLDVTHGRITRTVRTDNRATVTRAVTFSRKNTCRAPFDLRYATRNQGFVRPTMSHDNQALPEEKGRWNDSGLEAVFRFRPKPGETFRLKVEVLKGFDAGHRDVHLHLRRDRYYQTVAVSLDLAPYLAAGWTVTQEPHLHFHAEDPEDHDMCAPRGLGRRVAPLDAAEPGTWRWELHDLGQGVVDLVWDVAPPPGAVA
jgi:pimeloyl-ACP methyl ester carboxylesterase